mmetsp:Transcript_75606/g.149938  ORF Transcript_75606/g.149938 Transcript_75606/m.149938 type:complete len:243 (-) Transcript_75606:89-817(-)
MGQRDMHPLAFHDLRLNGRSREEVLRVRDVLNRLAVVLRVARLEIEEIKGSLFSLVEAGERAARKGDATSAPAVTARLVAEGATAARGTEEVASLKVAWHLGYHASLWLWFKGNAEDPADALLLRAVVRAHPTGDVLSVDLTTRRVAGGDVHDERAAAFGVQVDGAELAVFRAGLGSACTEMSDILVALLKRDARGEIVHHIISTIGREGVAAWVASLVVRDPHAVVAVYAVALQKAVVGRP